MTKRVIIGLCGAGKVGRQQMVKNLMAHATGAEDATVSDYYRVPWGRAEQLQAALAASDAPVVIAAIKHIEEAQIIEHFGGQVMHVQGPPSEEIAIERDTVLISPVEARGRYVLPHQALEHARLAQS